MTILGETKDGYIVSLNSEEVAKLSGYSSRYSTGYIKPIIGSDINISTLVDRINNVEKLYDSLIALKDRTALDNATFDYIIDNNGTIEELIIKVKEILIKEKII